MSERRATSFKAPAHLEIGCCLQAGHERSCSGRFRRENIIETRVIEYQNGGALTREQRCPLSTFDDGQLHVVETFEPVDGR
jgi:hypothetical protein